MSCDCTEHGDVEPRDYIFITVIAASPIWHKTFKFDTGKAPCLTAPRESLESFPIHKPWWSMTLLQKRSSSLLHMHLSHSLSLSPSLLHMYLFLSPTLSHSLLSVVVLQMCPNRMLIREGFRSKYNKCGGTKQRQKHVFVLTHCCTWFGKREKRVSNHALS